MTRRTVVLLVAVAVLADIAGAAWWFLIRDDQSADERAEAACEAEFDETVFDAERAETYEADTFEEAVAECVAELERMGETQRELMIDVYND